MAAPLLRNVADAEVWSLTDPHTLLHRLTNPTDDQSAILQMLASELDLATSTDIWTAWADAFTTLDGPQLPLEFRAVALDTLTTTLITPAILSAQTPILAQWDLHSIPIECLQAATYGDIYNEKDMAAWYDLTTHPSPPQPSTHHHA